MIRKRNTNGSNSPKWHHQTSSLPLLSTLHKRSAKNNRFGIMLLCSVLCILVLLGGIIIFFCFSAISPPPPSIVGRRKSYHGVTSLLTNYGRRSSRSELSHHSSIKYVDITIEGDTTQYTYDVIIVGCGPAGIGGALFASRMGLSVLVLGSPSAGSLSGTDRIDNFPAFFGVGGQTWIDVSIEQAYSAGAQFASPTILATGIDQVKTQQHTMFEVQLNLESSKKVVSKSVIIATGSIPHKLELPHETTLWGNSLHNCALCDGDVYVRGDSTKSVAVIGGGDAAVEAIFLLHKLGVDKIHWVHRRTEYKASAADVEKVRALHNVEIWNPFVVVEWKINGDGMEEDLKLEGIRIVGATNDGTADVESTSSLTIPCDGAFLMIGSTPNTKWLANSGIDIDPTSKLIRLHQTEAPQQYATTTSIPGIFAAGEVVDDLYRQALTASADGAKAAIDAQRYMRSMGMDIGSQSRQKQQSKVIEKRDDLEQKSNGLVDCDLTKDDCIKMVVTTHPVVVFSKSYCPYCRRALEIIGSFSSRAGFVEPLVIDLTELTNMASIQDRLAQMTGRRTVPNVYIGGTSIGGGDETLALYKSGKLETLLGEAGAITMPLQNNV